MNKKYAAKLTVIAALLGAAYLPQAQASQNLTLGTLSLPVIAGSQFYDDHIGTGAFTDSYTFSVNTQGKLGGSLNSSLEFPTSGGTLSSFTTGVELTSLSLFDLTTSASNPIATLNAVQSGPTHPTSHLTAYSDAINLSAAGLILNASDTYELEVSGKGGSLLSNLGSQGDYVSAVTITAVPEPQVWAMLLLVLPALGWFTSRKPGNQAQFAA